MDMAKEAWLSCLRRVWKPWRPSHVGWVAILCDQPVDLSSVAGVERGGAGSIPQREELVRPWQGDSPTQVAELQAGFWSPWSLESDIGMPQPSRQSDVLEAGRLNWWARPRCHRDSRWGISVPGRGGGGFFPGPCRLLLRESFSGHFSCIVHPQPLSPSPPFPFSC